MTATEQEMDAEMEHQVPAFHVMVKPRGPVCNLHCGYCYYLEKEQLYPDGEFRMTDQVLEAFTQQYIGAQQVQEVTFAWQGGEPTLMGLEFYQRAVELQEQYHRPGMDANIRNRHGGAGGAAHGQARHQRGHRRNHGGDRRT